MEQNVEQPEKISARSTAIAGVFGALAIVCCVAGPAVLAAVTGIAAGGAFGLICGIAVAVVVAIVALALMRRRRNRNGGGC